MKDQIAPMIEPGVCPHCGALLSVVGATLQFGGRQPAHFICGDCKGRCGA